MAADYIGKEILIHTDEGKFYGTIHSVDVQNQKIVLQKVSTSNGTKMRGLQIFFTKEIQDLLVLEDTKNDSGSSVEQTRNRDLSGINESEAVPTEPEHTLSARDPSDEGSRLIARPPLAPNQVLIGDESFITKSKEDQLTDPPDLVLIDKFDEKYENALQSINNQRVVGLSAEGNKIGRSGTLCLLVVGCRQVTYIFDIYQLGEQCMSNGLKSFLENCYILKVIHDCRLLSDCLFHKYNISMKNIFDTQVADIIIYKQSRGKIPRDVNGIGPCLLTYLRLNQSKCMFLSVIHQSRKRDADFLINRPLSTKLLNAVAEKVLYLRELRIAQMEIMLAEFLYGVDVYLQCFRDSEMDYSNKTLKVLKVPDPFYDLKKISEKRWKTFEAKDTTAAAAEEFIPGDESKLSTNPEDSIGWTEGNLFAEEYSKKHGRILERDDLDNGVSMANRSHPIDTEIAPWRRTSGPNAQKDRGASSTDVIFKSEASLWQPERKKKGRDNDAPLKQQQSNVDGSSKKGKTFNVDDSTDFVPVAVSQQNGKLEHDAIPDRNKSPEATPSSPCTTDKNKVGEMDVNGDIPVHTESYNKSVVHTVNERKVPADWFDYDTPSSDRSRASSFGSDTYVTPSHHRHRWQQGVYEEEFPMLSPGSQNSNPEGGNSSETESHNFTNSGSYSKIKVNGGLGVNGSSTKRRPLGRAKSREYFTARSPLAGSPIHDEVSRTGSIGGKSTTEFPRDDDLLQTDPILKSDLGNSLPGQKIRIHKLTPK